MGDDVAAKDFTSGPWRGFYVYSWSRAKHWMDLSLTFADGKITGDGIDDIGRFSIKGRYDEKTREVWWAKTYPGSHDVQYHGSLDANGIWGDWAIHIERGNFHIWPVGMGEHKHASAETDVDSDVETEEAVVISPDGEDLTVTHIR